MFLKMNSRKISTYCRLVLLTALTLLPASGITQEPTSTSTTDIAILKKKYTRPPNAVPYPETNPYSAEKAHLGKLLFFDPRLSKYKNLSCVSCHHPGMGWEIGLARPIGSGGVSDPMPRKSQTLLNLAWAESFFWDGRSETLEEQIKVALQAQRAIALTPSELLKTIQSIDGYGPLFKSAFQSKESPTWDQAVQALATFIRGIVSGKTPFDRWIQGDETAISREAKNGFLLFNGKAKCATCHSRWNFTDGGYRDIGLASSDLGRGKSMPHVITMQYAFKTPSLREIAARAPYMHDGSLATLELVIKEYEKGGSVKRPGLSPDLSAIELSKSEEQDLIAFLKTLSSPISSNNELTTIPPMVF